MAQNNSILKNASKKSDMEMANEIQADIAQKASQGNAMQNSMQTNAMMNDVAQANAMQDATQANAMQDVAQVNANAMQNAASRMSSLNNAKR